MEFKGTNGKWKIYKDEVSIEVLNDNVPICLLANSKSKIEKEANARLIVSSLELITILKELVADLEEESLSTSINDTIKRANKIINKALGDGKI